MANKKHVEKFKQYYDMKLKSPNNFLENHKNSSCLIISTGNSTKQLLNINTSKIKSKFDIIIGINFAVMDFDNILDYHIVSERDPVGIAKYMNDNDCSRRVKRVFNFEAIHIFNENLNFVKFIRLDYNKRFNITKYKNGDIEGLVSGPFKNNIAIGTVLAQALHFACLLGCNKIYTIGTELLFYNKYDHYYEDRYYRDKKGRKPGLRSPIVNVAHNNKKYQTTRNFKQSAEFLNFLIDKYCTPGGIDVFDFSGGLITSAKKLSISEFIDE